MSTVGAEQARIATLRAALKKQSDETLRAFIRGHLRLAVLSAVTDYLNEDLNGDELLFKEVFEACVTPDERSSVNDEIRDLVRRVALVDPLPSNLFIYGAIDAAREELAARGAPCR